jgi:hypothetical protein
VTASVIRLSVTDEVSRALHKAKKRYPALSDPEILKLGLSKIVTEVELTPWEQERDEIRRSASYAVGFDYLNTPEEDEYTPTMGTKVHFP